MNNAFSVIWRLRWRIKDTEMMGRNRLKICVCTSYHATAEPRAPRHATALAKFLSEQAEVVFIDCAPLGAPQRKPKMFDGLTNLAWETHHFSHRAAGLAQHVVNRVRTKIHQARFQVFGTLDPVALSPAMLGFERRLRQVRADIYLGHNLETLLPVWRVARQVGALAMFDSMEFHSDMGSSQSPTERALIRRIEQQCLPACRLVLASSEQVAEALAQEYGIRRPVALYNTPVIETTLPPKPDSFALYWRNSTIGLCQRGLDDALRALTTLPADITLHLQGHLPDKRGAEVTARINALGLTNRVTIHPPYLPDDAVKEAARFTVGLCLERAGNRNHDLTVSNKIFDYHMAGLATIASDLPGLRSVIERSGGGLLFQPGSSADLAEKILRLYHERSLLEQLSANARAFALREGHQAHDLKRFTAAFAQACQADLEVARLRTAAECEA